MFPSAEAAFNLTDATTFWASSRRRQKKVEPKTFRIAGVFTGSKSIISMAGMTRGSPLPVSPIARLAAWSFSRAGVSPLTLSRGRKVSRVGRALLWTSSLAAASVCTRMFLNWPLKVLSNADSYCLYSAFRLNSSQRWPFHRSLDIRMFPMASWTTFSVGRNCLASFSRVSMSLSSLWAWSLCVLAFWRSVRIFCSFSSE
mmetsp:Transcript_23175/g.45614  ORF Transcript_23175/g.45614 Transcript_23175/m.45614 type:complete len:200 (-) Transcript_23175:501-1100(-)